MPKHPVIKTLVHYAAIAAACLVYAVAFNWFFTPNEVAFGGVTGIAQVIHALFGTPSIGVLIIAINVPLFLLGWKFLGGRLLVSSLFAMAVSSVFIDLVASLYTFPPMEPLLACIYGGVGMGGALGIVFRFGATTGGTDLAARLLKLKLGWLPMGRLLMGLDLFSICVAAIAFRKLDSALYGVVALYIASLAMDGVLYGLDTAKVAYIISERPDEITAAIISGMDRGVTLLEGRGGYSGAEKQVLLCAFKRRQIVQIRRIVKELDPAAFLIVCDAHEVLGDGFREYRTDHL